MTYPPDHAESQRLFEELKRLDEKAGDEQAATEYEIIHDLAEAHFYEAKPYFVAGLNNPDPDYRWHCISALVTHWRVADEEVVSRLLDIAENDTDITVRDIALASLGTLKVQEALPLLKRIVQDEPADQDLQKTAYLARLEILGHPPEEIEALWKSFHMADFRNQREKHDDEV